MIFDWAHIPMLVSGVAYARGTVTRRHTMIVMQNFIILLCTYVDFKRFQTKFCGIKSVQAPYAYMQAMARILQSKKERVKKKSSSGDGLCNSSVTIYFFISQQWTMRIAQQGYSFQK